MNDNQQDATILDLFISSQCHGTSQQQYWLTVTEAVNTVMCS
jgi:hypothetical protein